jgi:hypothetical protein
VHCYRQIFELLHCSVAAAAAAVAAAAAAVVVATALGLPTNYHNRVDC